MTRPARGFATPLLVLLPLLAGCAAPSEPADGPAAEADQDRFAWTGCAGASLMLTGPSAVYGGAVPPGWEAPSTLASRVHLLLYRCERVAWGSFERGPVTILQESHLAFSDPESCRGGDARSRAVLQSVGFSDPEVAAYARDRHRMPAYAADFGEQHRALGAGAEWEWTWTAAGGKESRVLLDEGAAGPPSRLDDDVTRVFWPDGPGVGLMDLSRSFAFDQAAPLLAHGVLNAPLLHARMPAPDFATAQASRHWDAHAEASLAHFRDPACLEPA